MPGMPDSTEPASRCAASAAGPGGWRREQHLADRVRQGAGRRVAPRHAVNEGQELMPGNGRDPAQLRDRAGMLVDPQIEPGIAFAVVDLERCRLLAALVPRRPPRARAGGVRPDPSPSCRETPRPWRSGSLRPPACCPGLRSPARRDGRTRTCSSGPTRRRCVLRHRRARSGADRRRRRRPGPDPGLRAPQPLAPSVAARRWPGRD